MVFLDDIVHPSYQTRIMWSMHHFLPSNQIVLSAVQLACRKIHCMYIVGMTQLVLGNPTNITAVIAGCQPIQHSKRSGLMLYLVGSITVFFHSSIHLEWRAEVVRAPAEKLSWVLSHYAKRMKDDRVLLEQTV